MVPTAADGDDADFQRRHQGHPDDAMRYVVVVVVVVDNVAVVVVEEVVVEEVIGYLLHVMLMLADNAVMLAVNDAVLVPPTWADRATVERV